NKTFYYAEGSNGIGGASKEDAKASGAQTYDIQNPGLKIGDGYFASDITVSQTGTEFTVTAPGGESERFHMRLIGAHNVINVVGAISVANKLGIALKDLRIPVRRIEPVPHRMQMREHGLVTIIDDAYNSNPVGSKAAVETLAMFDGVRILVTPGMVELGDKEREYNYKFGTYAADCCDYILLVGRKHTEPIREGVLSKGFAKDRCLVYDKLEEALSYAYSIKEQGHKYILLENDLPDNY
ncbi:MAG: UDP-N-acetylmuramoyl-tripeptide--D-alanyl-D-alanine ligase, partial [Lachnospiraceae bacterium]|nr:UDP-N-acetylmuramoyl-tripeptide--D-alanyl-D-alanine ligase [Lachnospiraceae bacterium]